MKTVAVAVTGAETQFSGRGSGSDEVLVKVGNSTINRA